MVKNNNITKVAVIGAGTMGAAIAQHLLMKNLDVVLVDVQQEALDRGYANICQYLDEAVERRIVRAENKVQLLQQRTCSTDYVTVHDRQFIVEAVFEDLSVKKAVFLELEKHVSSNCFIASNTSSFSITELGSVLKKQDRFIGVHYFYHAAKNKLIELIPGENTASETIEALSNFYYDNDKSPLW